MRPNARLLCPLVAGGGGAGQHDDARMCLALALTAARLGAVVTNYTVVTQLSKTQDGFVNGATVTDQITGTPRRSDGQIPVAIGI